MVYVGITLKDVYVKVLSAIRKYLVIEMKKTRVILVKGAIT